MTAVSDSHGETVVTGLLTNQITTQLSQVAIAELLVFLSVLVLAGVLSTFLVRVALRPLRRVAATATLVAELPLETGQVSMPAGVPDTDPRTEVGQVGAAFNRMLGHVERALGRRAASEARLRRFADDASHGLRTPLAAIRGYAEFALRHPGAVPEEVTHALGRVQSESVRMGVLVDDLLLLARLDAGLGHRCRGQVRRADRQPAPQRGGQGCHRPLRRPVRETSETSGTGNSRPCGDRRRRPR